MKNVLLIEDEEGGRVLFQNVLHQINSSYIFHHAKNVDDAVAILENENISIDVIFLDLNLPNKNGWYFLKNMSEELNQKMIKVFILTSSINEEDVFMSNKYGVVKGYYSKPVTIEKMKKINAHLQEIT